LRRDENAKSVKVSALARSPPRKAWKIVRWREGTKGNLISRFAALRVRPSHRDYWRERDFQDLKQEIGLDHYEGRGWRGFHHHAALSIAAYGFLIAERSPIPLCTGHPRSGAKSRSKPKATARAPPLLRPERHTPNSISTLRTMVAVALANSLPRCPCCLRKRDAKDERRL